MVIGKQWIEISSVATPDDCPKLLIKFAPKLKHLSVTGRRLILIMQQQDWQMATFCYIDLRSLKSLNYLGE